MNNCSPLFPHDILLQFPQELITVLAVTPVKIITQVTG